MDSRGVNRSHPVDVYVIDEEMRSGAPSFGLVIAGNVFDVLNNQALLPHGEVRECRVMDCNGPDPRQVLALRMRQEPRRIPDLSDIGETHFSK